MTRIALLADVHMRDEYASQIAVELERVVERLERNAPDHAFVLGDLIEDGESGAADRANVERVHGILEDAPCPVTYLLGNHDVENLTRDTLSDLLGQERFRGVVELDESPVVYLDSTAERVEGPCGRLGAEQRRWLRDVLPRDESALVLLHHPLGAFDISENVWFRDYPERAFPGDRKEVLDVLGEVDGVRATFSGHIHQTERTEFRGLEHVSINAFSKELPDEPLTGTFAEVSVGEEVGVEVGIGTETVDRFTVPSA